MGTVLKIVGIVLAVLLLAVVAVDARVCLEGSNLGGSPGNSASVVSSCVRSRLEAQAGQLRQQIDERIARPTLAPQE